jgi:Putative heavy-metal-binding
LQRSREMLVVTTENVAGHRVVEVKGQCFGVVVRSRGLGGNVMAGLRCWLARLARSPALGAAPGCSAVADGTSIGLPNWYRASEMRHPTGARTRLPRGAGG